MSYPFVQGIDYGPRSGTRGISLHMAEGAGTVGFLRRHAGEGNAAWADRVSGVSCHVVVETSGRVVQMLAWGSACGNLNPNDRAKEYGYYGHHHLVDVLAAGWTNPNEWTVSAELEGKRAVGPNAEQVASAIRWGNEMKAMFPTIRGATGHHDQSPKPCPGVRPTMKAIFDGLGGHGLWKPQEAPVLDFTWVKNDLTSGPGTVTVVGAGHSAILANGSLFPLPMGDVKHSYGLVVFKDGPWKGQQAYMIGDDCGWLLRKDVSYEAHPADVLHTVSVAFDGKTEWTKEV